MYTIASWRLGYLGPDHIQCVFTTYFVLIYLLLYLNCFIDKEVWFLVTYFCSVFSRNSEKVTILLLEVSETYYLPTLYLSDRLV